HDCRERSALESENIMQLARVASAVFLGWVAWSAAGCRASSHADDGATASASTRGTGFQPPPDLEGRALFRAMRRPRSPTAMCTGPLGLHQEQKTNFFSGTIDLRVTAAPEGISPTGRKVVVDFTSGALDVPEWDALQRDFGAFGRFPFTN